MADILHDGNQDQERRSNVGPGNTDSGFLLPKRQNVQNPGGRVPCFDHHFRTFSGRPNDQALWCPNCGRLKTAND